MSATEWPHPRSRTLSASFALGWALVSFAAHAASPAPVPTPVPTPLVSDADIARAQRSQPTITDHDMDEARRRHAVPTVPLHNDPPRAAPRIDALPKPAASPLDLGAIAEGYERTAPANNLENTRAPALLVFISLSMPEATLSRLVDQASRARAPLILRGFSDGSLTQTVAKVQRLIGHRSVGVLIDPLAFDRYAIESVPAFVLRAGDASSSSCQTKSCANSADYAAAVGDVSLGHALRQLGRASPGFARAARPFLARLEH